MLHFSICCVVASSPWAGLRYHLKTLRLSFPQLLEPLVLAACAVVTSDMNRYHTGVAGLARKSRYCLEGVAVLILHEDKMESKSQDPVPYIGQTGWAFWIPQKSAGYNRGSGSVAPP